MATQAPPFVTAFALQNYLKAEQGIIEAQQNNYQYWYIDCSLSEESPSMWDKARIDHLLMMIKTYHTKPLLHGNFKVPLASDVEELREAAVQYTKKEIDLAAKLNAPLIIHGSVVVEPRLITKIKKKALQNYHQSLLTLKAYADKLGVILYLENLSNYKSYHPFHYIFTHEEEFQYILESIDLPLFLDIGHANIGDGKPVEIFKKFHKRIAGMSFSNNDGKKDQHLSLSNGSVNYQELIASILDQQWAGLVAFETRGKKPSANIDELNQIYQQVK